MQQYSFLLGIVDAKEAITVSLVTSDGGVQTINSFHPKFAYAIFGKDEEIFGYKDLDIKLQYHASDMRPLLTIKYGKKFNSIGETEPADIEGALKDFLPPGLSISSIPRQSQLLRIISCVPETVRLCEGPRTSRRGMDPSRRACRLVREPGRPL